MSSSVPNRITKYGQLADWLRDQINGGALSPGDRLPSIPEMRARHDASVATVDRALGILENDGLIVRINGNGVFVAERRESKPVVNGRPLIGLILPNCHNEFFSPIIEAVEHEASLAGYRVLIANSRGNPDLEAQLLEQLTEECAGLLILPSGTGNQKAFAGLLERKMPFVLMDRGVEGLSVPLVSEENERGGYLATRHLLALGYRRIHVVAEALATVSSLRERVAGYRRALAESGVHYDPSLILQADLLPQIAGYSLTRDLLLREPSNHGFALLALNESTARGCYMALREQGRRVPHDAAVVGFGDLLAPLFEPPLTAIRQNPGGMGREAARRLIEFIKAGKPTKAGHTRLEVSLIVRGSSDPQSGFCSIADMLKDQPSVLNPPLVFSEV